MVKPSGVPRISLDLAKNLENLVILVLETRQGRSQRGSNGDLAANV